MSIRNDIKISNFFIFNSQYGNLEGQEHKKILFYHPNTDHLDVQIKNMGLAEAMIQFTCSFKPDGPISSLNTTKRKQIYYEPESNFWMVLTLDVPFLTKNKDGVDTVEYLGHEVQTSIFDTVLKQAYLMYRLFSGNFHYTIEKHDLGTLKTKLEQFFTAYLWTIKPVHYDLLNIFNGMQFLPLDRQSFLTVQCFINALECQFPIIKHTAFLYNEHLVWSALEPSDMQVVYQYLTQTLIPQHVSTELLSGSMTRNSSSPFSSIIHGRFITGPEDLKHSENIGKMPKIYIYPLDNNQQEDPEVFYLIVYRALSASLCMFINVSVDLSIELFKELDQFIDPNLTPVVADIAEYCTKQTISPANLTETNPRFIYFNKLNLAYKSTVHLDNKQAGNLSISKDCVKIMGDLNARSQALGYAGETIVKTMKDYWVVAKVSNLREFYIGLQQKQANLIDISEEVEKLCQTELKGIFFH